MTQASDGDARIKKLIEEEVKERMREFMEEVNEKIRRLQESGESAKLPIEDASKSKEGPVASPRENTRLLAKAEHNPSDGRQRGSSSIVLKDLELLSGHETIQLRGGEPVVGNMHEIKGDAYGAAMAMLCRGLFLISNLREGGKTWAEIFCESKYMSRIWFCLFAFMTNVFFTVSVCLTVNMYLVEPYVRHVQGEYADFRQNTFSPDGTFLPQKWNEYDTKAKASVCQIAMSNPHYLYVILCLHIFSSIIELRETIESWKNIANVSPCESINDMIVWEAGDRDAGGRCFIVGTPRLVRFFLNCINLYKLIIGLFVLSLGSRLLCSSTRFADVLLNALTLQFICQIDETIFSAFLPKSIQEMIRETRFFQRDSHNLQERKSAERDSDHPVGVFWAAFSIFFLFVYVNIVQSVLPADMSQVSAACHEFLHLRAHCRTRAVLLRMHPTECYPFGDASAVTQLLL